MKSARFFVFLGLLVIGVFSRLLPHPPNFTAMNALALFGAFFLGSRLLSLCVLFLTLFLSDLILGIHSTMLFVYLSFGLLFLIGGRLREGASFGRLGATSFVCSLLFFLVTNFGVWMTSGIYSKTVEGLCICYAAAIPFFANQLFADVFFAALMFGYLAFVKRLKSGNGERVCMLPR